MTNIHISRMYINRNAMFQSPYSFYEKFYTEVQDMKCDGQIISFRHSEGYGCVAIADNPVITLVETDNND